MSKYLQYVKNEYALELGYRDFEQITGERSVFVVESILDDVAIRYAQSKNKELVIMLHKIHNILIKRQYPTEQELSDIAKEIEQLIKKTIEI